MKCVIPCAGGLLSIGLGVSLVIGTQPLPGLAPRPNNPPSKSDTIKQLQEERIAVLKEVVDQTEKAFKAGQVPASQIIQARLDLLKAQLDASRTKEDRVRVLEETVKQAEALEAAVKRQVEAKNEAGIAALKAKAFVLETKIALERTKAEKEP